jgi:hypothetical protein
MPEFRHYADFDETIAILRDVFATHELTMIPKQSVLSEPRIDTFNYIDPEVEHRLRQFGIVELAGEFTKHPPQFKRHAEGGTYFLDDRVGPRLIWRLSGKTDAAPPVMGPGSISYYSWYEDPTGRQEPPSPELIAAFRAVVKTMKRHMVTVASRGDKAWVGRETKLRKDAGQVVIRL